MKKKFKITIFFAWYDMWIGAYYSKPNTLYIALIPCIVFKIIWINKNERI